MTKTSVFICDDHQLFRDGIKCIVAERGYEVIGEASNGKELLEKLEIETPDIILLDITMPEMSGYETAQIILKNNPQQRILIISASNDEKYYNNFASLGVRGYILKNSPKQELFSALQKISSGESFFSQSLLLNIIKNKDSEKLKLLTKREKEVLQLICEGCSNIEISKNLNISQRTVERHRGNLLRKTQSPNSIKLILNAIREGLIIV